MTKTVKTMNINLGEIEFLLWGYLKNIFFSFRFFAVLDLGSQPSAGSINF